MKIEKNKDMTMMHGDRNFECPPYVSKGPSDRPNGNFENIQKRVHHDLPVLSGSGFNETFLGDSIWITALFTLASFFIPVNTISSGFNFRLISSSD
jgi:hypothetical protein